jgi:NAD(P)-dependent dehydrogenase (short-subunit alcohol dehydrogenase family)
MNNGKKRVVVTGAARGIGAAVCGMLRDEGWHVIAADLQPIEAWDLDLTPGIEARQIDVSDTVNVDAVFDDIGPIEALVNCAGIALPNQEQAMDAFERVIDVNLSGTMRCCLAAKRGFPAGTGVVVNLASVFSFVGGGHLPAYCASKGGVAQLTRALAAAWAEDGVRVNAVAPGLIETEMTGGIRKETQRNQKIIDRVPLSRWGQPDEVAEVVSWMLSDRATFVTGSVYTVDGGFSAV